MPDTLKLTGARPGHLVRSATGALELAGRSTVVGRVQEFVRRAAALDSGVLLVAARGIDVEPVARELHARSRFALAPFVVVECGAGSAAELDRILFGSASTAAPADLEVVSADSRLAAAIGGTLFLQEIAELPAAVQARVARVARDREVALDGVPVAMAIRLVASTPPGIDTDVHEHRFRADLYRRLAASRIDLPSLRERRDDIPEMATRILDEVSVAHGMARRTFTQAALALLAALPWPGNLAELRRGIERVVVDSDGEAIQIEHLVPILPLDRVPPPLVPAGNLREARQRFEREYIAAVLQHHGWRMAEAAQTLGIQRPNLYRKARQLGIPLARTTE